MKNTKHIAYAVLATLLSVAVIGCGDATADKSPTQNETADTVAETETAEPDPFAEYDFGGAEIRINTSINDAGGAGNSNYLIEGPDKETGDIVDDSAFDRNRSVEEILNVKLVYTETDANYTECASIVDKIVMSGDDVYDIIIQDLFRMSSLAIAGEFIDITESDVIDLTQDYWYQGYMSKLSLDGKKQFMMAGDYFIDVLRSAHALYYNKDMMEELFDSGTCVYDDVLNGTWTYDKLLSYMNEAYQDLNGNGTRDMEDRYGLTVMQVWGPSIPFIVSAGLDYVTLQDDGSMTLCMNNERSVALLEKLNQIFWNDATCNTELMKSGDALTDSLNLFKSGQSLFLGYYRLGALESLRDMEHEVAIVPYPKLDENQANYVTSTHDTTEIGVIPVTCSRFDTVATVLEVLNRETKKIVLPAYYETALKIKYTRDDVSSQMIDIIHNNIGGSFELAYSDYCGDIFLKSSFYNPLNGKKTDFVSSYTKLEKAAQKKIDKMIEQYSQIDN